MESCTLTYVVPSISFQTYLVQAFNIVVDSWTFTMLLLYIVWDDRQFFYDFWLKWTATAVIRIHLTKAWLSQLVNFKNAIRSSGHFRRTICNKFCVKRGKNARETYGMLQTVFGPSCMNRVSVCKWHMTFKEGRESVRDDERCGRSKEVNTPELIGQTVRVIMLRF